jgi:pimeloyl-[acyl-carrier protein] synthase
MSTTSPFHLASLRDEPDPYAIFDEARKHGPVHDAGGSFIVFGHSAIAEILRLSTTRSGFIGEAYHRRLPPGAARDEMANRINFLDPPDHTRVRRLVGKAFTPRRTANLRPFVETIARELLADMPRDEPVDLLHAYAHELPSLVISELLGVPIEFRDRLTQLSDSVSRLLSLGGDEDEVKEAITGAEQMHATLRTVLEARRAHPEDDLLSALLAAEDERERLSEVELLSLAATLYSAGHRTTRDLFANGLTALLPEPALVEAIRSGALSVEAVVEEFLRFETPTHLIGRMLSEPLEVGGHKIEPGQYIGLILAAGNRDPDAYSDAHRFDPWRWTRDPAPPAPLSFALGAHFCIGASLARLEASVMLEVLLETCPRVRLEDEPLSWRHTGVFRGLDRLPVVLGN